MRRRLYLHIGHTKTASTTIQQALATNIRALRAAGFLVADATMRFPRSGGISGFPMQFVADKCAEGERGLTDVVSRFGALERELGDARSALVVSSESLAIPEAEYLGQALRHAYEIHVLFYIRRQDDWMASAWNQWGSKLGEGLTEYCRRLIGSRFPRYLETARRWDRVADTIRVRPLHPDALERRNIVTDFFHAIGAGFDPETPQAANQSFDLALLEVFRDSAFLFDSKHDDELRDWLRRRTPASFPVEKPLMRPELARQIMQTFEEENRALHAGYFPDVDYDAVFGARANESELLERCIAQQEDARVLQRLRKVVGLQFRLISELSKSLERLRARIDAEDPT